MNGRSFDATWLGCAALLSAAASCSGSDPKPPTQHATDAGDMQAYAGDAAAPVENDPQGAVLAAWPMPDAVPGAANKPSYQVSAKTVTDTITHLVWQRELPALYPGCTGKSTDTNVGGAGGASSMLGDSCSQAEAMRYCRSADVAALGGKGWHLPSKIELESLANHLRAEPAIDNTAFANTLSTIFWTSTLFLGQSDSAWFVDFDHGTSSGLRNTIAFRVRCVASEEHADGAEQYSFTSHSVKDEKTGLTWQRYVDPDDYEWAEAKQYCMQLGLDGGGWRLPTVKELLTLVDPTRADPAIDPKVFPLTPDRNFWSATQLAKATAVAWYVDFGYGHADYTSNIQEYRVRCVK